MDRTTKAYVLYRNLGEWGRRINTALVPATPKVRAGYIVGIPEGTKAVLWARKDLGYAIDEDMAVYRYDRRRRLWYLDPRLCAEEWDHPDSWGGFRIVEVNQS